MALIVIWWIFLRFVILDKECIGGEEKQVTGREIFTGELLEMISEIHDILWIYILWVYKCIYFHPSCLNHSA